MNTSANSIVFEVRAVGIGRDPDVIGDERDAHRRANQLRETYGLSRAQVTVTRKAIENV